MTPDEACKIVDAFKGDGGYHVSAEQWVATACTLREAFAKAESARLAAVATAKGQIIRASKAEAERDAALAKLAKAMKVVEVARAYVSTGGEIEHQPRPTIEELEAILNGPDARVRIKPDGSVVVSRSLDELEATLAALDAGEPT